MRFSSSRAIVVRGDLYSDTGYGRATRALCELLEGQTQWLFVASLHEHQERRQNTISLPVVSDAVLLKDPLFRGAIVVNLCLPNDFVRVSDAINVGYFFWETAALPHAAFWKARMLAMDRLWAPSRWQSAWLGRVTGRKDIPVMPWPLDARSSRANIGCALDLSIREPAQSGSVKMGSDCGVPSIRLRNILVGYGNLFLAVQTDAPRKGLALLLSSWMAFKRTPEGQDARLLIKLSSIDVSSGGDEVHAAASRSVNQARARFGVDEPGIWLMHESLSPLEMRQLFSRADAFVSATMGEGFGGPVAEALLENTPVIVPRHTAISDLLDEAYPLAVASEAVRLKLRDNMDVYSPSSTWHIVDDIAFVERLRAFVRMPRAQRAAIAETAKARLLANACIPVVKEALAREFRSYDTVEIAA